MIPTLVKSEIVSTDPFDCEMFESPVRLPIRFNELILSHSDPVRSLRFSIGWNSAIRDCIAHNLFTLVVRVKVVRQKKTLGFLRGDFVVSS